MRLVFVLIACLSVSSIFAEEVKDKKISFNAFNPNIGGNILLRSQNSNRNDRDDGIKLQEVSLKLASDIDSHFRAVVNLVVEQKLDQNSTGEGDYTVEPEEAYAETTALGNYVIQAGKARMPIGKHNLLDTHDFTFVDAPLINQQVFGEGGFVETGVGLNVILPSNHFSKISLYYVQGDNELLFNSGKNDNKVVVWKVQNILDMSDSSSVELGVSAARGNNNTGNLTTNVYSTDLTFKWNPKNYEREGSRVHSFEWGSEYLIKKTIGRAGARLSGIVSHLKYQINKKWFAQYRFDYVGLNKSRSVHVNQRHSGLLAFLPSEYSSVRLQVENTNDAEIKDDQRVSLQLNFSIGAFPAHDYY